VAKYAVVLIVAVAAGGAALAFTLQGEDSTGGDGGTILLAAGDIAGCAWESDEATANILDRYPNATVAALGDTVYPAGTSAEYGTCYHPAWGRAKSRTRPTVGNHEYHADAAGYFDYFGDAAGERGKGWYTYDLGAWRVVVLNSNCTPGNVEVACDEESEQVAWLERELAENPRPCTLAYFHQPRFSSGQHGSYWWLGDIWTSLYEAGADVILSAHDHDYERFSPQRPDSAPDPGRGIRQFVVGTGGAELRPFRDEGAANSEVQQAGTHGVLKLDLKTRGYDWEFVPVEGASFRDEGSGRCH
jgi:hypothetical protein